MKRSVRITSLCLCAAMTLALTGCGGKGTLLKEAAVATPLSYQEYNGEEVVAIREAANAFAAPFSAAMYAANATEGNYVLSPVSVFSGLSLAAACAAGSTKEELLSALGTDETALSSGFAPFYRSLVKTVNDDRGKLRTRLNIANAVYVAKDVPMSETCLSELAANYFCYSYSADFAGDNRGANDAVRNFVKEQTNGLIDSDFALPNTTLFTLVNALYLKDVWNSNGHDLAVFGDLPFHGEKDTRDLPFLQGYYTRGRAYDGDGYTMYFARTLAGYKVKFLLPDENVPVEEVFTAERLAEANAVTDFAPDDHAAKIHYSTRVLFPAFSGRSDGSAKAVLQDAFGVHDIFDPDAADLTHATRVKPAFVSDVRHIATLTVDKKGIEGAAATVLPAGTSEGPDEYDNVYLDFKVDRCFAFLLTDPYDTILFSGLIKTP